VAGGRWDDGDDYSDATLAELCGSVHGPIALEAQMLLALPGVDARVNAVRRARQQARLGRVPWQRALAQSIEIESRNRRRTGHSRWRP
jgi:hypothetical protein